MKKGLIMDMDGVVVDSELVYVKKFMTWFKKQGIEMGMSDFEKIIGTPYAEAIDYFMEFWGDRSSREEFAEMFAQLKDQVKFNYRDIPVSYTHLSDSGQSY